MCAQCNGVRRCVPCARASTVRTAQAAVARTPGAGSAAAAGGPAGSPGPRDRAAWARPSGGPTCGGRWRSPPWAMSGACQAPGAPARGSLPRRQGPWRCGCPPPAPRTPTCACGGACSACGRQRGLVRRRYCHTLQTQCTRALAVCSLAAGQPSGRCVVMAAPDAHFVVVVGGGGGWHKASVSDCLPLAATIGLSPLLILTLCGSERVLVVSTEPPDDLSCLTTPGVGRPGDGAVARAVDQGHPDAHSESTRGFADSSAHLCALGCASAGSFS